MESIIIGGILLILYGYLGYPCILYLFTLIKHPSTNVLYPQSQFPKVTLVIAAYNEEKVIGAKLSNCLDLNYPKSFLNIVVASDGSTDTTNKIVAEYSYAEPRIRLLSLSRSGKSQAINSALALISDGIVVFSDANTIYDQNAINELVAPFVDTNVGCVSGRLIYRNPRGVMSGTGESFYWRYETALKQLESRLGYVAGANGAIYAIRRELAFVLPVETINDDFLISMKIVEQGYKSIYVTNAFAFEDVAPSMGAEFQRHIRDGAGHYIAIVQLKGLLNPLLGIRSFIYLSHRITRWLAPFILLTIFFINIIIVNHDQVYLYLLGLQFLFYNAALLGWLIEKFNSKVPLIFFIPFYFCNLNLALFLGFFNVISRNQLTKWESTPR
jgi:biofilm PGA synthesis N-glycosyltransferase PgaC